MKVFVIVVVSLLIIGTVIMVSGSGSSNDTSNELSYAQIEQDISGGALLLDVRTPEEFNSSHIENSNNLSLQQIQSGALPDANQQDKIFVYCRSGSRSAQAKSLLEQSGYTNVVDLGGINEVTAIGGVVVR